MTSKLLRSILAIAVVSMISRIDVPKTSAAAATAAQTSARRSPQRAAIRRPSSPTAPAASTTIATGTGSKIGTINIEQAVVGTNEGQRDCEALRKKLEPKQNELKGQNDELENLQKQLQTQGDKLNEDARATLVKQIETKKKSFDRSVQDAQEDAQNQQKEIFQRILQKMAPVIVKHAQDKRLRHDCGYLEPLAAKPGALVWRRRRHYQSGRRSLQHAVRSARSSRYWCCQAKRGAEADGSQACSSEVNRTT